MQALQNTLRQIFTQLSKMPLNARLLIGSMMIIMIMALLLVSQYAGTSNLVPLGLPNTAEIRTDTVRYLKLAQINYEERADDIYVPLDNRFAILGQLNQEKIVTADQLDFKKLIDISSNPFMGRDQQNRLWLTAKMDVLAMMISGRDDVVSATVIIDERAGALGIGKANIPSTAAVMVVMRGIAMTQEIADSIGRTISGGHAGLKAENVSVTDSIRGKNFRPRSVDTFGNGATYLETKKSTELHYQRMIEGAIQYIPGSIVTVNAVVMNQNITSNENSVAEPKIGPKSSTEKTYTSSNQPSASEPGVQPNTGASIANSGGGGSQVSETETSEELISDFGKKQIVVQDATGYPLQINAVIGIPKSYFVQIYRDEAGDPEATPTAADLDVIIKAQTQQLKTDLEPLIRVIGHDNTTPGDVMVSMIHDFDRLMPGSSFSAAYGGNGLAGPAGSGGGGFGDMLDVGMFKNISLAALALISLIMMFLMVRRASVREELPTAQELVGIPPTLDAVDSDIVGEAVEAEQALEGVELDEDTMRTQQLLDQINDMITAAPNESSGLLQQWIIGES